MTKDAQKLLRHIIDGAKSQNSATVEIDISKVDNIPNIEFAQKKLLNELEAVGVISGYQANILGEVFVYLTSDGLEYFDDLRENKESSNIVFNVSGGQVNIANDKGSINAVINDKLCEKDTILESEYKGNKKVSLASNKEAEKVFISYSWTPDYNKKWVEQLVNRLESDGIEVVIDFKDLKLGHDKYAFMERTVNDDTIKKVLIICNKTYKEKADGRIGGVGDESAIITSQMYGNVRQEKFIPVVNEYDENGKPFLPNYLASRMYADLTDFEKGYEELLSNIIGNKISKKTCATGGDDTEGIINKGNENTPEFPNLKVIQNLWTQIPEFKLVNDSHVILGNLEQPLFIMTIPSKVYFQDKHSNSVHSLLTLSPISYEVIVEQINTGRTIGDISISKLPPSFKGKMGERDVIRGGIVEETEDLRIWIDTYPFMIIICDILYGYDDSAYRDIIISTPMGNEYVDEVIFEYLLEYLRDNAKYEVHLLPTDQNIYYKVNEMVKGLFGDLKRNQTFFCGKEGGYGNILKLLNQIITPYDILA